MQDVLFFNEREFHNGYNDTMKPELIPDGFAADAKNCVLDQDMIQKRNGFTMIGHDIGSKRGLGLHAHEESGGTKRLLSIFDNSGGTNSELYQWTGSGDHTAVSGGGSFTADTDMNFETANDLTYTFNGVDSCYKYDGSTASSVAATPITKYAKWFHNYMFCAGNSTTPDRLYFSNVNDPETWGGSDYIDVNPNDGDTITALTIIGDELVVSKRNRLWALTGFDTASFALTDLNERVTGFGGIAHRSFSNIGNDLLFLSFVGTMPHIRSLRRTQYAVNVAGGIISDDIEGTMSGLNDTKLSLASGIFDGRKYYLALANGSSTYNNLVVVYDTVHKGFVRWTGLNVAHWCLSTIGGAAEIYFQEASADSKVYKLDSSTSDNGAAIDFEYKTRAFVGFGGKKDIRPHSKAKWKYLYLTADSGSDVDITIDSSPDTYTWENEGTFNTAGSSSVLPFTLPSSLGIPDAARTRFEIGRNPTHMLQFRYTNNAADEEVTIREYSLAFKPKKVRDATR